MKEDCSKEHFDSDNEVLVRRGKSRSVDQACPVKYAE